MKVLHDNTSIVGTGRPKPVRLLKQSKGLITYQVTVSLAGVQKADLGYFPAIWASAAIDMAQLTAKAQEYNKFPHACWLARQCHVATSGTV